MGGNMRIKYGKRILEKDIVNFFHTFEAVKKEMREILKRLRFS